MFGLAYLVAFGVYLLISIGVVKGAIDYARKNGKSAKKWGFGAAFVMYSIVFWDWLPTVAVHQYYCAKDSGFWIYKTLDQWKVENPGVMEGLVYDKTTPDTREGDDENHIDTNVLNQRFSWVSEKQNVVPFLPIYRWRSHNNRGQTTVYAISDTLLAPIKQRRSPCLAVPASRYPMFPSI